MDFLSLTIFDKYEGLFIFVEDLGLFIHATDKLSK